MVEKHFRGHSSENMIFNSCIYVLVLAIYTDDGPRYTSERKQKTTIYKASSLPGHAPFMSVEEFTVLVEQLIYEFSELGNEVC